MMTAILLALCILSSGFTGNIYKKLSSESDSFSGSAVMPAVWFVVLAIAFWLLAVCSGEMFSVSLIFAAAISGVCIAAAAVILIESMKTNALSVSVIIINLNFIIPVVLSAIFLQESAKPLQLAGMLLSITVIVLLNLHGGAAEQEGRTAAGNCADAADKAAGTQGRTKPYSSIWLPLAACIANGLVNFCIKINEKSGMSPLWFFAVMYTCAMVTCLLWGTLAERRKTSRENGQRSGGIRFLLSGARLKTVLPYLLLVGVCNGVCFYTARLLAERMNAAAQFTVVTCASILLSLVVGFLFQGDRFTKETAVSIFFCILAVICQHSGIA